MNTERTPLNDKELWRSLTAVRGDAPEAVSDLDFAAWLEGRLAETEAVDAVVALTDCDRDAVIAFIRRLYLAGVTDPKRLTFKGLQALSRA